VPRIGGGPGIDPSDAKQSQSPYSGDQEAAPQWRSKIQARRIDVPVYNSAMNQRRLTDPFERFAAPTVAGGRAANQQALKSCALTLGATLDVRHHEHR
jgi:hypothetical protein